VHDRRSNPFDQSTDFEKELQVRNWFSKLSKVSDRQTSKVFDSYVDDVPFILKVYNRPESKERYTGTKNHHEAFVGLFGTNPLRKFVPNFAYVLGTFVCRNSDGEQCCRIGERVRYVMYENVIDSVDLTDFIDSKPDEEDVAAVLLQLLYALHLAHRLIDFTHFDLHGHNIRVRKLDKEVCLPYLTERGGEFIVTRYIPVIIDYESSHFVYKGEHYGARVFLDDLSDSQMRLDSSYAFYDFYRMVVAILISKTKKQGIPIISKALDNYFFRDGLTDEEKIKVIERRNLNITNLSREDFGHLNHLDFARVIRSAKDWKCIKDFPPPGVEIWNCGERLCLSQEDIITRMSGESEKDLNFHKVSQLLETGHRDKILKEFLVSINDEIEKFYQKCLLDTKNIDSYRETGKQLKTKIEKYPEGDIGIGNYVFTYSNLTASLFFQILSLKKRCLEVEAVLEVCQLEYGYTSTNSDLLNFMEKTIRDSENTLSILLEERSFLQGLIKRPAVVRFFSVDHSDKSRITLANIGYLGELVEYIQKVSL
jgi:hypothetical protein